MKRTAIRISSKARRIDLAHNTITGFAVTVDDRRGVAR